MLIIETYLCSGLAFLALIHITGYFVGIKPLSPKYWLVAALGWPFFLAFAISNLGHPDE